MLQPQLHPKYYAAQWEWLKHVPAESLSYNIGVDGNNQQKPLISISEDNLSEFRIRHHPQKTVDIGAIDFLDPSVLENKFGGEVFKVFDVPSFEDSEDHIISYDTFPFQEELKQIVEGRSPAKVFVDGYALDEENDASSPSSLEEEDTRVLQPLSTNGVIIPGQNYGTAQRMYTRTDTILPVGMCGCPVFLSSDERDLQLTGLIEGIVPLNPAQGNVPRVLWGAAAYSPIRMISEMGVEGNGDGGERQ